MDRLRVLIAEDNAELRNVVVELLSKEFHILGAVGDGEQLVEAAMILDPDIIVTDVDMPLMDGFYAMDELRSNGLECPFVFITMMNLPGLSFTEEDGPIGYVHKTDFIGELVLAIHTVALGNSFVSQTFRKNRKDP